MTKSRLTASILIALFAALPFTGCTSVSAHAARTWQPRTYALLVADDQGVLPPATFKRVEIALVQYLIDGGFVRSDERYVGDVMHADVVFRVKIAWQDAATTSFAVAEIAPSYANGAPAPVAAAVAEVEPDYSPWYYDPWFYGDYYGGYCYGPWSPFLGVAAILPIYGIEHPRRPHPPIAHRPPTDDRRREHRPPNGYTRYTPRPGENGTTPGYRRGPSAPDNGHPAQPIPPATRRRDNDSNRPAPAPGRSDWHSRPSNFSTPPPPANTSAQRQHSPDSSGRSSTWHRSDSGSKSNPYSRSPDGASAPRYSPSPARNYSAPSGGSYSAHSGGSYSAPSGGSYSAPSASAPSYSAPASSSSSSAGSSSSPGPAGDNNSRTQQR